ncbi:MAG TPA: substrate-binding domain-containing protein [Bryobacterales bacterium]|jgi:ribose transport system substrate-binding protein|nr:substrate-binding domain-containing protein [Bryobacterales bacterium]
MRAKYLAAACLLVVAACNRRPAHRRLTLAVIPMGTTHEYWKSIHAGAVKAAREEGVDLVWKGPQKEDDRAQQIAVVEDMISRHVDGIILAPLDGKGLQNPVSEARRAGIPAVIVDSHLEGDDYVSFIATDNYQGGRLGARRLAETLGDKGSIILMRVLVGVESTMARERGFLDEIHKHSGIRILSDNQYGGITTETAYQTGENLLNRFPDVDGIFCPNESTTFGMLRALTDAGKAGKVKFVGFDSSEKLIDALRRKQIDGLVLQNPFRMGELGVKTLVRYLHDPQAAIERRIDTGAVVATPANMDTPEIKQLLSPPLDQYLSRSSPDTAAPVLGKQIKRDAAGFDAPVISG